MDKIREEFEVWAIKHHFSVTKKPDCASYVHDSTMCAFEGWKASRAALCVELPSAFSMEEVDLKNEICGALYDAGVSYK